MRLVYLAAIGVLAGNAHAGEIREFSISTLERLGNELSRRDQVAARASDLILESQPVARSLKVRGWITDLNKDGDRVYWITDTPSGPSLAYIVTFRKSGGPEIQDVRGQPIPSNIAVRYKARGLAADALKGKLYNLSYNFEVLDDPDGSGFLVYALGATTRAGEVVLAGHFRVTIDRTGEKVERIDPLSRSVFVLDENAGGGKDATTESLWITQLVSNKPVETFVYTSNLVKKPIVVGTPDRAIWNVSDGKIKLERKAAGTSTK